MISAVLRSSFALAVAILVGSSLAQKPAPPDSALTVYRNPTFAFRYRIPYGWVDRTKEMQEGNDASKGEVLLAVFERPPQAAGDSINSAVVIASEKAAAFPGVKRAEDYLGTLTGTATAQGFKAEGEPSEIDIDSQRMVRADFSKPKNDKLTMHQTTLVLLSKGQIVSFTFIAESVDALDGLIDGLSFSAPKIEIQVSFGDQKPSRFGLCDLLKKHVPKSKKKRGLEPRFGLRREAILC